jgi:thioredoxin-like negative regulator of GroEL
MNYEKKYLKYKEKYLKIKSLENMIGGSSSSTSTIYLFKAEWCGHCKSFAPVWADLQEKYKGKYRFVTYDEKTDRAELKKFGVDSFPTIILQKDDKAIEYVGSRDPDSLSEFITAYN